MNRIAGNPDWKDRLDGAIRATKQARLLPSACHPPMIIGGYPGPLSPQDLPPGSVAIPDLAFQVAMCVSEQEEAAIRSLLANTIQGFFGSTPEVRGGCINDNERWGAWAAAAVDDNVAAARQQAVEQLSIAEGFVFAIFVSENLLNAAAQAAFQASQSSPPAGTVLKSLSISLEAPDKTITYIRGNEQLTLPSADFTIIVTDTLSTADGRAVSTPSARFDGDLWALIALSFLGLAGNPYWAGELGTLFFNGAPDGSEGIGDELVKRLPTKFLTAKGKQLFSYTDVSVTSHVGITFGGSISAEVPRNPQVSISGSFWLAAIEGKKFVTALYSAVPNDEFSPDNFSWSVDGGPLSAQTNSVMVRFNVPAGSPAGSTFAHTIALTATDTALGISASASAGLTVNVVEFDPPLPPGHGPQHPPRWPPRWPPY